MLNVAAPSNRGPTPPPVPVPACDPRGERRGYLPQIWTFALPPPGRFL